MILIPYVLIRESPNLFKLTTLSFVCIIILGVIHTGLGFYLFFSGMQGLKGQIIASLSYVDPITSLLASVIIFDENMTLLQIIGGMLLLGATFLSQVRKHPENPKHV
jgi:drug/metabolite transporter (DMT)-like permease